MEWTVLIPVFVEVLSKCLENRTTGDITASLEKPGFMERMVIRQTLKNDCDLSGSELRAATREGMQRLKDANGSQIDALVSAGARMRGAEIDNETIQAILGE